MSLTSPTWRTTYFFVAQPVDITTATNRGTSVLIEHLRCVDWSTIPLAMQDPNLIARRERRRVMIVTSPAKCGGLDRAYAMGGGANARGGRSMKGIGGL